MIEWLARLIPLFPLLACLTTLVLGALIIGLAVIAWWLARTMAARASDPVAGLAGVPGASPVTSTEQAR